MMSKLIALRALDGYRLFAEFADGVSGTLDLTDRLFGPVFSPLKEERLFKQVRIDEFGAPVWPNGADLAPDALYMQLRNERARSPATPG
jgi:hypothetical protein